LEGDRRSSRVKRRKKQYKEKMVTPYFHANLGIRPWGKRLLEIDHTKKKRTQPQKERKRQRPLHKPQE